MNEENETTNLEINETPKKVTKKVIKKVVKKKEEEQQAFLVEEDVRKPKLSESKPKPTYTQH